MDRRCSVLAAPAFIMAAACLIGCEDYFDRLGNPLVPDLPQAMLRNAPASLLVDGKRIEVRGFLWRDFEPATPPSGSALMAVFILHSPHDEVTPADIRPAYLWVLNGGDVWEAVLHQQDYSLPNEFRARADGGPKWGPEIPVDVVLGVLDSAKRLHLVAIRGILIGSTGY